jgi:hypothetical protein
VEAGQKTGIANLMAGRFLLKKFMAGVIILLTVNCRSVLSLGEFLMLDALGKECLA